ncbi:MAG: hypothetical protein ACRERY_17170 [Pseudomonas sp.]
MSAYSTLTLVLGALLLGNADMGMSHAGMDMGQGGEAGMPGMAGMDHSSMSGMDHAQMAGMDHGPMAGQAHPDYAPGSGSGLAAQAAEGDEEGVWLAGVRLWF